LFEQNNFTDDSKIIKEYTHEIDSDEIKLSTDILHHSGTNTEERKKIEIEQEAWRTVNAMFENQRNKLIKEIQEKEKSLLEKDNTILEKENTILEKENTILEKDNTILEKDNTILEKDNTILEKEKSIVEKDNEILEKDKLIAELLSKINKQN
jgi:uncharacterized protein (DUF3084 family)